MKRKMKLNKEKFGRFIAFVAFIIVTIIAINNPKQGTISRWHDAAEQGMSWQEYMRGE